MKSNLDKEKNFVSAVVYLNQNSDEILEFLESTDKIMSENFETYEYILVDDSGKESAVQGIHAFKTRANVSVIKMAFYHGREKAMKAGVDLAIGDFVYEFDTTCINYDTKLIFDIYKKALEGYDLVSASQAGAKKHTSKTFYRFLEKTSYNSIKLQSETFRIVSRRMINRTSRNRTQFFYRKAAYHNSGFHVAVVEYTAINDKVINDNLKLNEKWNMAMNILITHSNIGTRFAAAISLVFLLFTIAAMCYTVYTYLTLESIQPGWATTMLMLSVSFTGVFLVLYIITKYLVNILVEVRKQPMYVYKSVDKIKKGK